MTIHQSVLELIGHTPMMQTQHLDTGVCELFLKLESDNPGGSIKDRIGLSMIEGAEKDGSIKPGDTLVEGTAGNTGLGLALVAQQKGYRLILVVPDKMSREKIFNLKAMGAEVVLTRSDVAKGHPDYYQDMAERIAAKRRGPISSTSSATRTTRPRTWTNHRPGDSRADGWQGRCDGVRLRLVRHHDRPVAILRRAFAADRIDPRRSGRLDPGRIHQRRHVVGEIRQLDGRGHRRGFPARASAISRACKKPTRSPTRRAS